MALLILGKRKWAVKKLRSFEINSAEIGFGNHKVTFKPNELDQQIAYSIWVELSTRKIGLPIDLENDVIIEVYDSWYAFFNSTRSLIKEIPVSKVRNDSTSKIINISIEVLNEGLRPHLTAWQARFRHWYSLAREEHPTLSPQDLQRQFPDYQALLTDLLEVNEMLINYKFKLNELVQHQ